MVQANGMYFQLDFGAPASMSGVTLDSSGSRTGDAPVSFAVLISDDGVAFEVVASGNGDADGITTVSFDVRTARFLRIQQFGSSATNWWSIHEIVVDGLPDGPTDLVQIRQRSASNFGIASTDGGSLEQNVFLVPEDGNDINQQWVETDVGDGFFMYQKNGTNFCLDGDNGGANRQNVYLWPCQIGNQNQIWRKDLVSGSTFRLVKSNATGFALDGGSNATSGQNVQLFDSSFSSQNIQWILNSLILNE